ncbi:helix-turn-helix domain-containing protein [Albibacterium profundi]|uniref:Helix-turn-helix domain-containing protein n=1 Tax=Albibacterium profundi TaxID=3134906 RepID=A0ABV5CET7_9SPHI
MSNPFEAIDERLTKIEELLQASIMKDKSVSIIEKRALVTRKTAAKYLCVSEQTIIRLEQSGSINPILVGGSIRFDLDNLNEFIKNNTK